MLPKFEKWEHTSYMRSIFRDALVNNSWVQHYKYHPEPHIVQMILDWDARPYVPEPVEHIYWAYIDQKGIFIYPDCIYSTWQNAMEQMQSRDPEWFAWHLSGYSLPKAQRQNISHVFCKINSKTGQPWY